MTGLGAAASGLMGVLGGPWGAALAAATVGLTLIASANSDAKQRANALEEAQTQLTKRGRIPTRTDTPSNPPEVSETLLKQKVVTAVLSAVEQKRWQSEFQKLFKPK